MWPIQLASLIRHLFLAHDQQVCTVALVWRVSNILHVDLAATLMIFGLVILNLQKLNYTHHPSY